MKKTHRVIVPLAYMAAILLLSSIPNTDDPASAFMFGLTLQWVEPQVQNLLHIPLFGGLAWCWFWALSGRKLGYKAALVASFTISTTFSMIDELYQLTVPGRFGSFTDFCLDVTGVLAMCIYQWRVSTAPVTLSDDS